MRSAEQPRLRKRSFLLVEDIVYSPNKYRETEGIKDATDPLAFVRWHYDKKHNGIYAIDECYGQKISNRQAANWIKSRGYQSDRIGADSA